MMPNYRRKNVSPVYIPALDAEHMELFRALEALREAVGGGVGTEATHSAVARLVEHFGAHLAHEEKIMRAARYPALDWHLQSHDAARKRAKQVQERMDAGDAAGVSELVEFFKGWLRDHTGLHDRMMSAYVRNFERLGTRIS